MKQQEIKKRIQETDQEKEREDRQYSTSPEKYQKYKVEDVKTTPSGIYSIFTSDLNVETWTSNWGDKEGDIEEMWDYNGRDAEKVLVNGRLVYERQIK